MKYRIYGNATMQSNLMFCTDNLQEAQNYQRVHDGYLFRDGEIIVRNTAMTRYEWEEYKRKSHIEHVQKVIGEFLDVPPDTVKAVQWSNDGKLEVTTLTSC